MSTFLWYSTDIRDKICRHTESKFALDAHFAIESLARLNANEENADRNGEANQVETANNSEPATPTKRHAVSFSSPPKSIGKSKVRDLLHVKFGSMSEAKTPKPFELLGYGIKNNNCKKVA